MTTKSAKTEIAEVPAVNEPERFDPTTHTWEDVTQDADTVLGFDKASDEILDALAGVPHLITRVTYRKGDFARHYVSCEVVLAPRNVMERRRVNLATLPFDPGDLVVYNDGSTGIRRQVTAYLYAKGFISLPEPITEGGKAGESSFDLSPDEWAGVNGGDLRFTPEGEAVYTANVRIFAKRGIRISDGYENEWTKDGKTRYLA